MCSGINRTFTASSKEELISSSDCPRTAAVHQGNNRILMPRQCLLVSPRQHIGHIPQPDSDRHVTRSTRYFASPRRHTADSNIVSKSMPSEQGSLHHVDRLDTPGLPHLGVCFRSPPGITRISCVRPASFRSASSPPWAAASSGKRPRAFRIIAYYIGPSAGLQMCTVYS